MIDRTAANTPEYVVCRCGAILETRAEDGKVFAICPACPEPWDHSDGRIIKPEEIDEEGFYLVRKP